MPYIVQTKRDVLDPHIKQLLNAFRELECDDSENNMGANVNYVISQLLHHCYSAKSYAEMAKAVSVLEMAKLEFYRTICAPYETQKSFDNGSLAPLIDNIS